MRIAVLGLGVMGRAAAARLLERGHDVAVWNRTRGREGDLVRRGAHPGGDIGAAVREAEVVVAVLTDDEAVRTVCLGQGGVRESIRAGAVMVDMSTVHPRTSRELAGAFGEDRFVDAPILGGPAALEQGQPALLLGGDAALVQRLEPLWADLSARWVHCGPAGAGTTLKLASNLLLLEELVAVSEAAALARAAGIDIDVLTGVLRTSPMVPPGLQNRLDNLLGSDHPGWFPVTMGRKDLRLARELARDSGLDLRLAAAADELYRRAEEGGNAAADVAAVVEAVRTSRPQA